MALAGKSASGESVVVLDVSTISQHLIHFFHRFCSGSRHRSTQSCCSQRPRPQRSAPQARVRKV
jgi:hypothetical protein